MPLNANQANALEIGIAQEVINYLIEKPLASAFGRLGVVPAFNFPLFKIGYFYGLTDQTRLLTEGGSFKDMMGREHRIPGLQPYLHSGLATIEGLKALLVAHHNYIALEGKADLAVLKKLKKYNNRLAEHYEKKYPGFGFGRRPMFRDAAADRSTLTKDDIIQHYKNTDKINALIESACENPAGLMDLYREDPNAFTNRAYRNDAYDEDIFQRTVAGEITDTLENAYVALYLLSPQTRPVGSNNPGLEDAITRLQTLLHRRHVLEHLHKTLNTGERHERIAARDAMKRLYRVIRRDDIQQLSQDLREIDGEFSTLEESIREAHLIPGEEPPMAFQRALAYRTELKRKKEALLYQRRQLEKKLRDRAAKPSAFVDTSKGNDDTFRFSEQLNEKIHKEADFIQRRIAIGTQFVGDTNSHNSLNPLALDNPQDRARAQRHLNERWWKMFVGWFVLLPSLLVGVGEGFVAAVLGAGSVPIAVAMTTWPFWLTVIPGFVLNFLLIRLFLTSVIHAFRKNPFKGENGQPLSVPETIIMGVLGIGVAIIAGAGYAFISFSCNLGVIGMLAASTIATATGLGLIALFASGIIDMIKNRKAILAYFKRHFYFKGWGSMSRRERWSKLGNAFVRFICLAIGLGFSAIGILLTAGIFKKFALQGMKILSTKLPVALGQALLSVSAGIAQFGSYIAAIANFSFDVKSENNLVTLVFNTLSRLKNLTWRGMVEGVRDFFSNAIIATAKIVASVVVFLLAVCLYRNAKGQAGAAFQLKFDALWKTTVAGITFFVRSIAGNLFSVLDFAKLPGRVSSGLRRLGSLVGLLKTTKAEVQTGKRSVEMQSRSSNAPLVPIDMEEQISYQRLFSPARNEANQIARAITAAKHNAVPARPGVEAAPRADYPMIPAVVV